MNQVTLIGHVACDPELKPWKMVLTLKTELLGKLIKVSLLGEELEECLKAKRGDLLFINGYLSDENEVMVVRVSFLNQSQSTSECTSVKAV